MALGLALWWSAGCAGQRAEAAGAPPPSRATADVDRAASSRESVAPAAARQTRYEPSEPPDFAARVREARALLLPLRAEGWTEVSVTAANALDALAQALVEAPVATEDRRRQLDQVRAAVDDLRRAEGGSFELSLWIGAALSALHSATADQAEANHLMDRLAPWLASAARAQRDVSPDSLAAFQMATIQDAFRTLSDAMMVLAREIERASLQRR